MKKIFLALFVCTICVVGFFVFVFARIFYHNNISVSINDSEDRYQVYASYPLRHTSRIHHYLENRFHNHDLRKRRMEGYVSMDEKTHIYIASIPGRLIMKLDKKEHDLESRLRFKQLGEDIKIELTREN